MSTPRPASCSSARTRSTSRPTTRRGRPSRPTRRSTTRTRTRASSGAGRSPPRPRLPEGRLRVASQVPWDVDAATNTPTLQSRGNNERSTEKWFTNARAAQGVDFSSAPTRDFVYPWTNLWHQAALRPGRLHAGWERDRRGAREPHGDAQPHARLVVRARLHRADLQRTGVQLRARRRRGRPRARQRPGGRGRRRPTAGFPSRDNANQNSPADGISPTTNMYLWQPIPAAFYSPCVDGDYDMSVIAHEYTHMISNRMVAGPSSNLSATRPAPWARAGRTSRPPSS